MLLPMVAARCKCEYSMYNGTRTFYQFCRLPQILIFCEIYMSSAIEFNRFGDYIPLLC